MLYTNRKDFDQTFAFRSLTRAFSVLPVHKINLCNLDHHVPLKYIIWSKK